MKRTRKSHKTHTFSIRVPEKVRFGLDVLATKNNAQMSALVLRAIEDMFEREGLARREPGQLLSLLDRLWSESEYRRLRNIQKFAPELLNQTDRDILDRIAFDTSHEKDIPDSTLDAEVERLRKEFADL